MTSPWELPDFDGHEAIHQFCDAESGLRAIIAIHSTHLGPAGGGVRFWHYATSQDAMTDALRLSRGMSYKNAMAGLAMGGGKGVILAGADRVKTKATISRFAAWVESLNGQYITAQDVGMSLGDMICINETTKFVSGLPPKPGRAGGDPGPSTAYGVFLGVQAAARHKLRRDDLAGVHVAIQGVGSVGGGLARHLKQAGAKLTLADLDETRAKIMADELSAECVAAKEIHKIAADVFSPCALGGIINDQTLGEIAAPIVAGGANNQLARHEHGDRLVEREILFAPDYVINAGGIINVATGYFDDEGVEGVEKRINNIPALLSEIWAEADEKRVCPAKIADEKARRLIGR